MSFDMSRLANRQYGPAADTGYYGGGGVQAGASFGANVSVGSGDARWTGIAVVVALILAWVGYHGLKGG